MVETKTEAHADIITGLAAFEAFQSGIRDRLIERPQREEMTVVGHYRMLDQ
ncbi:hypothetical protein [Mesorhizobium sp. M7A.F.Ca.ET.027.03.2.1]